MRGTHSLLERIYERNPENGNFIIEVSLTNYADIFNDWDHAPFKRKDIHPELLCFLEDSIDDIPMKNDIDICFYLSEEMVNEEREQIIKSWFRTFYAFYIELEKRKIRSIVIRSILYLIVAALLLLSSYLGERNSDNSLAAYMITEIAIVGGWVFLWETISLLTFERSKIYRLIKNYKRFVRAAISFRYK